MKKRKTEAFGEGGRKADYVRSLPCVVSEYGNDSSCGLDGIGDFVRWLPDCKGDIEAAHAMGRGAGGTWRDIVPLCRKHHHEQHATGILTFESKYAISLTMAADLYEALYQAFNPDNVSGEQT